ncbi:MAG: trypsin-like peptidase domain-containing protein [Oscillospiraceae bacterium]|jgi:serine protease Do|nr:trypsin-like peptidase domain-containing protein [Oscillospiraceae bacterium]
MNYDYNGNHNDGNHNGGNHNGFNGENEIAEAKENPAFADRERELEDREDMAGAPQAVTSASTPPEPEAPVLSVSDAPRLTNAPPWGAPAWATPVVETPARIETASEQPAAAEPDSDWREAEYREYSAPSQSAYTPGIPNGALYAPPRRDRRDTEDGERHTGERQPRRRGGGARFMRGLCLVLMCAVVGAASGLGSVHYGISSGILKPARAEVVLGSRPTDRQGAPVGDGIEIGAAPTAVPGTPLQGTEIYKLSMGQVVGVSTEVPAQGFMGQSSAVYGSGFIISEDGYILTNYHVVQYASNYGYDLSVSMRDGTSYKASVVGYEADNDVAVVKIDARELTPVTIGSSAGIQVGESVWAVGNPRQLDFTMTEGIVSALDREVLVDNNVSIEMFQISAAVNSGNSGGPVYNEYGEVLGIVSAKYASVGTEGLGFAIPIDDAMSIASDLITHGYVSGKAYLGITVQTMEERYAQLYNMTVGAVVMSVETGSCAEKAGIKQGDIITKLGKTPVTSEETLKAAKRDFKAGDATTVEVFRSGETLTLDITFDEQAASRD